jgi:hypothetical protein
VSFQRATSTPDDKVDSSQAVAASAGALQNLTLYLNGTFANLTSAFHESSEFLYEQFGIPPGVLYGSLTALVAIPLTMHRYGWSREQVSPYGSVPGGIPAVTDEDFSYITSQDLDDPGHGVSDPRYRQGLRSEASSGLEDDVLLIKNKGVTYPAHFPAYAIGDGKLCVKDVRDRAGLMMGLSERGIRRIKLLYKGKQLKEPAAPIRDYGVKNKSELMAMVGEGDNGSSPSDEEMVIVDEPTRSGKSSRRRKNKKSKKTDKDDGADSASSPRDSTSTFDPSRSPQSPTPADAKMQKLDELAAELNTKWLPLCKEYIANPPADPKKREEEHRRLSESLLQQILLKLDGVEPEGIVEVRARRKELVKDTQTILKTLDVTKNS